MPDTESDIRLTPGQRATLLRWARQAIVQGLARGEPAPPPDPSDDPVLSEPRGVFVTLHRDGELRGCIGSLDPLRPLAVEVARCAYAAAFEDPRFAPLTREELDRLDLHISVLNPLQPMIVADEADLVRQLRPGVDGLLLDDPPTGRRGTFLPSVWMKLPDPADFVAQLKLKARLRPEEWPATLRVARYTVESIPSDTDG